MKRNKGTSLIIKHQEMSDVPFLQMTVHHARYLVLPILLWAAGAHAGNWPQWRGPAFNGSTEERPLPETWGTTEGIAWSSPLAGAAASTPIVWEGRVFLSGVDQVRDQLQAMCFDRVTGRLLWSRDVARGTRRDHRSNYASNSPVTDGTRVVFFFGTGDLVCYDFEGKSLWARNLERELGPFAYRWTLGTSPLLYGDTLYVQVLQRDVPVEGRGHADRENRSFLLALDPLSGRTRWQHFRPSRAAGESQESHTTPIPMLHAGRFQLLVAGGDAVSGHDPATGRELWRWDAWNPRLVQSWPLIASPVAVQGLAFVCVPKNQPVYAVRVDRSGKLDDSAVAWNSHDQRPVTSEVPTPAVYDGDLFVVSDSRKSLTRLDPRTGRVKWTMRTPGLAKYEASPLAGDGRIYLINFAGEVVVVRAADGHVLHEVTMDHPAENEMVRASIIAAYGQLFIRTTRRLYCVGSKR
jgi:outer membrane protein assembly factor BamB